jgi:hypothetical protein
MDLFIPLFWILILAFFFAKVEIQIEGDKGWAAGLPTWRIEKHWLLDIFWGGRELTGYHAWVFPFIILLFHTAFFLGCPWSIKLEAKLIALIMAFWIIEDFLWFILNPHYRFKKFTKQDIPWHSHRWFIFMPTDYWFYLTVASLLFWYSKQ